MHKKDTKKKTVKKMKIIHKKSVAHGIKKIVVFLGTLYVFGGLGGCGGK